MHAALVIIATLVACGRVGFDARTDGGGGTLDDGKGNTGDGGSANGDGGGTACIAAQPASTFPGASFPCFDWGGSFSSSNAMFSEANGTLTITPFANVVGATGRCTRDAVFIGAAGARVEVSSWLAGASSRTRLEIDWGGNTYFIGVDDGTMVAGQTGITLTGGAIERWWRIRPQANDLLFETSDDGTTFVGFGSLGNVPTGMATLRLLAITVSGEPSPGVARFESVNMCP